MERIKWQLRNRVNALSDLEPRISLTDVERAGVLLAGRLAELIRRLAK